MRRTKIVCTLGPASNTKEKIAELVDAGMSCARLNFSHGDHESHARVAKLVREAAREARTPMAILADMQGPKMRIGKFAEGRARDVLGDSVPIATILHPSPASPIANRGWAPQAEAQLRDLGIALGD